MRVGSAGFGSLVVMLMLLLVLEPLTVHASTPIAGTSIVLDSTANGVCDGSPNPACGTTLSWSHTVGSGSNGVLIVGVYWEGTCGAVPGDGTVCPSISGVKYGSDSLTLIDSVNDGTVSLWDLVSPSPGTNTVTVTFAPCSICSPEPSVDAAVGGSSSYFNVASVGSPSDNTGSGSPASVVVNANSGDLVVDTFGVASGPWSSGTGQNQRWNQFQSGGEVQPTFTGAGSDKPAASPVTMTWTSDSPGEFTWGIIGVPLTPAATTTSPAPPIPEYPQGLPILAILMLIVFGLIRRKTRNDYA